MPLPCTFHLTLPKLPSLLLPRPAATAPLPCPRSCMAAKLKSLTSPAAAHHAGAGAATPAALGEQVVATSTLASFLSYLCFSHAGGIHMSGFGGGASGELAGSVSAGRDLCRLDLCG